MTHHNVCATATAIGLALGCFAESESLVDPAEPVESVAAGGDPSGESTSAPPNLGGSMDTPPRGTSPSMPPPMGTAVMPPGMKPPKRPNIVLILADDLGYETIGAYGGTSYQTPHLDQMAADGMLFANGHSNPLCTPSRVKIMTGRYNYKNYYAFMQLKQGERTFAHAAQEAGYATQVAGKWQLVDGGRPPEGHVGPLASGQTPEEAGFDEHCVWQLRRSTRGARYWNPTVTRKDVTETLADDAYGPDVFNDCVLDFIDRHQETPFFSYYAMVLPHGPFVTTPDAPNVEGGQARFGAMVAYMDKLVGRVIAKLDETGLSENTIVWFVGDNGTSQSITSMVNGEAIKGGKGDMTEAGTHVPWIASWPGTIPAGSVNEHIYDFTVFLPTVAELMGANTADYDLDGRSIFAQLRGEPAVGPNVIYEFYEPVWSKNPKGEFARTPRYKLNDDGNLYDIDTDRLENDAIPEAGASAEVQALRQMLQQTIATRGQGLRP